MLLCSSCQPKIELRNRTVESNFPKVILWAWERPENLEFLDPERFGVAFLAQTLELQSDEVVFRPRRQPLKIGPATKLIAVTRIESLKNTGRRASLSSAQREELVSQILRTLELKRTRVVVALR